MVVTEERPSVNEQKLKTQILGIKIVATGLGVPQHSVGNDDLNIPGCDSEWIVQRTGILSRFHASENQSASDLAGEAAERCLLKAGVSATELDLIIVATMTPDHFTPSTSCILQARLGARCPAFDMNAACSGFMYALVVASQFIKTGCYQKILVVGAEKMSMVVDNQDPKTFPLFGDGAGAILITSDSRTGSAAGGLLGFKLASEGELGGTLIVPACGSRMPVSQEVLQRRDQFLKMEGRTVFKWAVRVIPDVVQLLLDQSQLNLEDIDLFIFHQANRRIIDAAVETIGCSPDRVFVNLDRYGNTSAASIPISLHEAVEQGRIKPGSNVLLAGFGAGLTWGGCIFRW